MPVEGKNRPTWADFGTRKGEMRPSQPQIRQTLFITNKLQPWTLFQGSLPRGSLVERNCDLSLTILMQQLLSVSILSNLSAASVQIASALI